MFVITVVLQRKCLINMFKRGDIVWGKLKTFPWWPAIVLDPKDCGRFKVGKDKVWLFWFDDHKVTQVECSQVLDFEKYFKEKCNSKMGKALKSAIQEVLTILATRYNIKSRDPSSLFEWAKKSFKKRLRHPIDSSKSLELPDIVKNALQKEAFKPKDESDDEIVNLLADVSKGNISLEDICVMCCQFDNSVVMPHPFFVGGVCQYCMPDTADLIKIPRGQMNDICIMCCQGGNLVYCSKSSCLSAYCKTCLDYMTPEETLSKILENNDWECYLCSPNTDARCLIKKREVYLAASSSTRPVKKSQLCVMGINQAVATVLMQKKILIHSLSYMTPKTSNCSYNDFSAKEMEDIDPDFVYDSYFVASTAGEEDKNEEYFFASFYKFLYRLTMARSLKSHIFFMYMCDADINELTKRRVKRFLQVDPTEIKMGVNTVYLWSNLPTIKDVKSNLYLMKKRSSMSIEENILHKFLEPLNDFFLRREIK